jgi:quercetin dioxygenase-like cupin family protein
MKVIQLGADAHSDERHEYPEALIVTDGAMNLIVDGAAVAVKEGGMYVVPPGVRHTVGADSSGTLVIVD